MRAIRPVPLILVVALAALMVALTVFTTNAQSNTPTEVPSNWVLTPAGLSVGDEYRLLFATSGRRNAESSSIGTYNTFVQNAAASGHTAIQGYSSGFRVVGSTEDDDARDNTSTTYTSSNKGVPIYWLGGNKLADQYQDFYDGTWDDETNSKDEDGSNVSLSGTFNRPWTGSKHNGTGDGDDDHELGKNSVRFGSTNHGSGGPIQGSSTLSSNGELRLYGLSEVFRVAEPVTVPAPSGLTAAPNGGMRIDLDWDDPPSGSSITGYKIERRDDASGSSWSDLVADTDSTATEYSDTGLRAGATYRYRVSAHSSFGTSSASAIVRATTQEPPGAPTGLTATANGSMRIDLSWSAPANDGGTAVTGYRIEHTLDGGSNWSDLVTDTDSTGTSYSDTGLPAGATRYYRVSAINAAGASDASNVARASADLAEFEVPYDWGLIPSGLGPGDSFRLLFVSADRRTASPDGIVFYNAFVQEAAASGHADIQEYSSGFRTVGSTEDDDARDNTATTYTAADKGIPIYWLGGSKVADDYEDFYDGDWDDEDNATNESGTSRPFNSSTQANRPFTGSDHDGTESFDGTTSRALGKSRVRVARANNSASAQGPIGSTSSDQRTSNRPFYGLSAVFRVDPTLKVTDVAVISNPAISDTYGLGETIEIAVTFNDEAVAAAGTDFVISVGGKRRAGLIRGSGTKTLVFGYTVQAGDTDGNGIWIGDQDRTLVGNRDGEPQNGAITSSATGDAAVLTHAALLTLSGHKVDGAQQAPQVTIAADQTAFTAELDAVTFTLTRTDSTAVMTVAVELTQDQEFLDSGDRTQSVMFESGESTASLVLEPRVFVGHGVTEDGTLTATVQAGAGYVPGTEKAASTSILVISPAVTVRLEEASYTFDEDGASVFVLVATTASGVPLPNHFFDVSVSALSGTARAPDDYERFSHQPSIQPSDFAADGAVFTARLELTLMLVDDALDEEDETFSIALQLAPSTPVVVGLRQHDGTACVPAGLCPATATITDNDPTPTLSVAPAQVEEGDSLTFTVTLSAESGREVTVDWTANAFAELGDSATAGTDFTAGTGTLTFTPRTTEVDQVSSVLVTTPGETAKTFNVSTTEDETFEPNETFTVVLSNPSNAEIGNGNAKGTIENDDDPTLVSNTGQEGNAQSSEATFAQRFTIGSSATASMYTLAGVDVVSGGTKGFTTQVCTVNTDGYPTSECTDLTPPDTFEAGTMSFAAPANITLSKGTTYTVVLDAAAFFDFGYTTSDSEDSGKATGWSIRDEYDFRRAGETGWNNHANRSVRIAIKGTAASDDDANAAPSFSSSATISVAENETAAGTVLAADSDTDDDITGYAITGGADQSLFSIGATSGDLTFDAAPNYEDAKDQGSNNTYVVDVTATSGMAARVKTATQTITVTVTDVDEGQSGTVTIDDTAPMVGDELTASTANLADPDGLPDPFAPAWQWYRTPDGGSETAIPGAASATYTVVEADLGATLTARASWTDNGGFANTLSSAPTGAVAAASALPTLSVANGSATEGSLIRFPLTLSAEPGEIVSAQCIASFETGDTAAAADLASDNSTATIQIGSTSGSCAISSAQDTIDEENETFTVTLSNPSSNAQLATDPTAKGTINDNDDPPTLSVGDLSADEGDTSISTWSFTVTLSTASGKTVTVDYATSVETGDTATAGTDFVVDNGTLTFNPGVVTRQFHVIVDGDTTVEDDETFTVTLSNPSNATISDATAKGTIENDDEAALDVLVSNYPDGSGSDFSLNFVQSGNSQRHYIAQTFTADAGFTLTAVDIPFRRVPDNSRVTVSLHALNGSKPGTYLAGLDLSEALAVGDNTFAAPAGTALAAGSYFVRVRWRSGDTNNLLMTDGPDEETSAESGWSIEDISHYSASGSSWSNWNQQFAMRVRGTIDGVPRVATGGVRIESDPDAHDSYGVGEEIEVAVGFTDDVTVDTMSGTPRVELTVGSNTRYADYSASDSSADELAFLYEVTADDQDQDGVSIDADALELNGGAIHKDGDTSTNAVLGHAALDADSDHRVNRDPFIVSDGVSVISDPQALADTYGLGEVIEIEVEFSAEVDAATGTDFVLSVSGPKRAPLLRGSGTKKLVFGYTVVASDDDDSGIWIGEQDRTLVGNREGYPQNGEITSAVTDRAADLDHDSPGVLSGHKVDGSRTTDNVAPSFTSDATIIVAENETAVGLVRATDRDADDSVTGYAITGGADQTFFSIGATSGVLTFDAAPDYEDAQDQGNNNTYVVDVTATSGADTRVMTATQTITVTVTDVDTEAPGKPGAPAVASASATSLSVNWSAPSNTGPAITDYDYRYRPTGSQGSWTEVTGTTITATTVTIGSLQENISYQVQVRAKNAEGTGSWSDSGSGTTDAAPDNCTGDTTTTCEVDVGGSATGNIGSDREQDWFKVELEAGKRYQFDVEGADTSRGNLADPYLWGGYDSTGSSVSGLRSNDGGVGKNGRDTYTPTAAGTYYIAVADATFVGRGTYTLSVIVLGANGNSEANTDCPATTATTCRVDVGASATGNIGSNDIDWFRVDLETGKKYQFDLEGADTGRGTLGDPNLSLFDGSGIYIGVDDNSGTGLNSQIVYTATETGAHYLRATRTLTGTGTYTLSVRDVTPPPDDCTDNTATTCEVDVGGSAMGNIDSETDVDWFRIDLVSDTRYQFDLEGDDTTRGNLGDPYLQLANSLGNVLGGTQNRDSGVGDNARVIWTPANIGNELVYLIVEGAANTTGSYTLSVIVLGANGASEADTDCSAATTTTCQVEVGASATGNIADSADTDWFRVDLEADRVYQIDMEGADTGRGTLPNPRLRLYDASGVNYVASDTEGGFVGNNARLTYAPDTSARYFISASRGSAGGTYTLSVREVETEEPPDDLPANTTTTGTVEVDGSAVRGDIYKPFFVQRTGDDDVDGWDFDTDWFAVELEEGRTYRIDMKGAIYVAPGTLQDPELTLPLPQINAIYNEDGEFLVNTRSRDESDSHHLFRVTFHAYDDGAYYIAASGESHEWGTYELTVIDITRDDGDYTNDGNGTNVGKGLKNLRAVEERGGIRLTWQPPDGTAVTGYRIERRRADGQGSGPQRSHGQPKEHHTLVEDTGSAETSYVDESAEQGVEYEYRVTARNESGPGESSDWVRAGPEEEPVWGDGLPGAPRNLTATPGNKEVTLSWDPPDDNGNPPATRYRIEWRVDGKDYDRNDWGTSRSTTYTTNAQANLANGVKYFFRVKAENDDGNSHGPYGPASGEVSATPTSGSAVDLGTPVLSDMENLHHGILQLDWQDVEDAGWYVAQYYHVKSGEWLDLPAEGVEIAFHGSSAVVSNLHGLSWLRVGAASCAGASEWSQIEELYGTNASDWEGVPVPEVAEGDETEPCPVVLGTPVLSETEYLHHGMVQLDWQDIEDAGWYVVQYYHVKSGEWLDLPAAGVEIAFRGSTAVVSDLHGLSWLRVGAAGCAGESEWSQIEQLFGTNASDWEGVPVPEVAEGDEIEPCSEDVDTSDNSPATGAPTISGTAQVGETLTANTSGVADADGLGNVQYEYQWLADDTEIAGATGSTYTLVAEDEGKAISVQVSFTDGADNEETLTSEATDAVAAAPTTNSPATGAPTISGTAQVGETLTADTSGIADADGLGSVQYEHQWLADDAEIAGATGLTYTLTDSEESKAIKVQVSFTDDAGNKESVTSAATDAVAAAPNPNSPATGAPTISGTAQVEETLTANTSGVADADGLGNVQYEHQWLADDSDISGATNATYTLVAADEGKVIKVRVTFTDDEGNDESLTSAATDAVAARPNSLATGAPTISGTVQVGEALTADTSGLADADGLTNATFSYQWLADDTEIAGATSLTYTLVDADEGKAIKVEASFTDDEGNDESLTSAATAAVAAAEPSEPPDKPTGLFATATHDQVTLTWDDPQDESITGYVVLRRVRVNDQGGDFSVLVANTGTAAATYTDDTVVAETTYTYRIKAINGAGTSERSRWIHIDIPAAPVPDKPTGLSATATHDSVTLTWNDPGDDSITGYVVLRRLPGVDPEGQFDELVSNTGTAELTYTDDTVSAETRYTYRIKAINGAGPGERSRWYHIDTPAAP